MRASLLLPLLLSATLASPTGAAQRVLIVGDSWAKFINDFGTMDEVFAANGLTDFTADGTTTTENGAEASEIVAAHLPAIAVALAEAPTVDVVQLTAGGNDFLSNWNVSLTDVEEAALFESIADDVATIVDFILDLDPGYRVVVSTYDYANFVDATNFVLCPGIHSDLGNPTPLQFNTAALEFSAAVSAALAGKTRAMHVDHYGWMQNAFGFPGDGILPGDLVPPGDLSRPSPIAAMLSAFGLTDCTHLNATGYRVVGDHLFEEFYRPLLFGIFEDGFETGDTSAWSGKAP